MQRLAWPSLVSSQTQAQRLNKSVFVETMLMLDYILKFDRVPGLEVKVTLLGLKSGFSSKRVAVSMVSHARKHST